MNKLTTLVDTHIANISAGKYSDQQLRNLFINIDGQEELLEQDSECLIQAIEYYLRISAPRIATKIFGPKDMDAREQLARIWQSATQSIDVTRNRHGNGVKNGGSRLRGEAHVVVYIFFKNTGNQTVTLDVTQVTPKDPLIATLRQYVVGGEFGSEEALPYEDLVQLGGKFSEIVARLAE